MTTTAEGRLARLVVDAGAVAENWRRLSKLSQGVDASAVLKADAYGLGMDRVAASLWWPGCQLFFVASAGEGVRLRSLLGARPAIYVLNGLTSADVAVFAAHNLVPVINSMTQLQLWRDAGRPSFALHVDTGMNRLGIGLQDLGEARDVIGATQPYLLMSHLACASERDHPMNDRQRERFQSARALLPARDYSLASSAGALLGRDFHYGILRPGIALFGSWASDAVNPPSLQTTARAYAPILQLRTIAAGETVGYGATFTAEHPMRLATVAAGYADGVPRSLSGKGVAAVENILCPYVGRVSMDLLVIDVSHAPNAQVGGEVELLGDYVRLDDLAALAGMIPYELLTQFGAAMRKTAA